MKSEELEVHYQQTAGKEQAQVSQNHNQSLDQKRVNMSRISEVSLANSLQRSRAQSDKKIMDLKQASVSKAWLRGTQYCNFESTHQLPNYLQTQSTKAFIEDALNRKIPESKSQLGDYSNIQNESKQKDLVFPASRIDLLKDHINKKTFDLNRTVLDQVNTTTKNQKRSAKENYVDLKHGVSADWPATHVSNSALRTSKQPAYIDVYNRETLSKTQIKQRNDSKIDILPVDL